MRYIIFEVNSIMYYRGGKVKPDVILFLECSQLSLKLRNINPFLKLYKQ